ncbi:hypothetical protein BH18THE2_BH18THE2_10100 [soil metagenome]
MITLRIPSEGERDAGNSANYIGLFSDDWTLARIKYPE